MDNLQQGADNGLSHTTIATDGGGGIETICNDNDGASSRKNSNVVLPPEGIVLPPEGTSLCLFYVCLYIFIFF